MANTGSPTIATGAGGDVYVTTESDASSMLARSTDGGATFAAAQSLTGPGGDLGYPQLDAGGGVVIAGGSGPDGGAWLYRIE